MATQNEQPRRARQRRSGEILAAAQIAPTPKAGPAPVAPEPRDGLAFIERVRDTMTVRRVFGDPIERDGVTVIPAANVTGGGGGGGDVQGNAGGGFGVVAKPAGAYVIKDGEVRWEPAFDLNRTILVGQIVAIVALLTLRSIVKAIAKRR